MSTNDELRAAIAAMKGEIALSKAELEMDAAIADAVARGVLMVDPNFHWYDLEVQ